METNDQRSCRYLDLAGQSQLQINSLLRALECGPDKDSFFSDYLAEVFELGSQLMKTAPLQSIVGKDGPGSRIISLVDVQWFLTRMEEFLKNVEYDPDAQ